MPIFGKIKFLDLGDLDDFYQKQDWQDSSVHRVFGRPTWPSNSRDLLGYDYILLILLSIFFLSMFLSLSILDSPF